LLVRNPIFQKQIARVIVDEAHNIETSGLAHYGLDAFRPAWGKLDEIKAILPNKVAWLALSATVPDHILKTIETKILCTNYELIRVTLNRPNTIYATHQVVGTIDELRNYRCLILPHDGFEVARQPRTLIFVDNTSLARRISRYLDSLLPPSFRDKGIVRHYHSKMSEDYLQRAHNTYTTPDGICRIMVATAGQSVVSTQQFVFLSEL